MKRWKKLLFIAIWMFVLMFCYQQVFADGTCGTNVKYTISGNTISFSKTSSASDAVWGSNCGEAFKNEKAIQIVEVAEKIKVENAKEMFREFIYVQEMYLSNLDVSNVTDMFGMFYGCESLTALDTSGWNTSKVTNMSTMFRDCSALKSLNINGWNTSNVESMAEMFWNCNSLTSLDVSGFDTSNVTDMWSMFMDCSSLTSLDVSGWKTPNMTNMSQLFAGCSSLTSLDVSGFDTSNVTEIAGMFIGCENLTSLDVSGWNTSNVTDMYGVFYGCQALQSLDVSGWNTDNVTEMNCMFLGCESLSNLDVSNFNTANVTDMSVMFGGCSSLTALDVSGFNTSKVTDMGEMFSGCKSLTSLDVSGFDTSNVTDMHYMFWCCESLTNLDVSSFNTSNVTGMGGMFAYCYSLTSLDVSGWDTSSVKDMNYMFDGDRSMTSLDVSRWNTSNVTGMSMTFRGLSSLTSLNLRNWDTSAVESMYGMFSDVPLEQLTLGKHFVFTDEDTQLWEGNWSFTEPDPENTNPIDIGTTYSTEELAKIYNTNAESMAGTWVLLPGVIDVTVQITGIDTDTEYDGSLQSFDVQYEVYCEDPSFDDQEKALISYNGEMTISEKDAGIYPYGLSADDFSYEGSDFNVTFEVIDGSLTITPVSMKIRVTGNVGKKMYNGREQTAEGFTLAYNDPTGTFNDSDVTTVSGVSAKASLTDVGTAEMGLTDNSFTNQNPNFDVQFVLVSDGSLTIDPKPLMHGSIRFTLNPMIYFYDGLEHIVTDIVAIRVYDDERKADLVPGVDYEIDTENTDMVVKDPGPYTVTITADNKESGNDAALTAAKTISGKNYEGHLSLQWRIVGPNNQQEPPHFFEIFDRTYSLPNTGLLSGPVLTGKEALNIRSNNELKMSLQIPTLSVEIKLISLPLAGNTWETGGLNDKGGVLEGSALPGEGYSIIAAHNTLNSSEYGPFAALSSMKTGDLIFVTRESGKSVRFVVYANELLRPNDFHAMKTISAEEPETLMLVTCEDESISGQYLSRRVIFAKPIN